jgi:hypothetical protein
VLLYLLPLVRAVVIHRPRKSALTATGGSQIPQ